MKQGSGNSSYSIKITLLAFLLLGTVLTAGAQPNTTDSTIRKKSKLYVGYGNYQLLEPYISDMVLSGRFLQYGYYREARKRRLISEMDLNYQALSQLGQSVPGMDMAVFDYYLTFYFPGKGIHLVRDKLLAYVGPNIHMNYLFYSGWDNEEQTELGLFMSLSPGISFRMDYYLGSRIYLNAIAYAGVYNLNLRGYVDEDSEVTETDNYFLTGGFEGKVQANVQVNLFKWLDLSLGYRHVLINHHSLEPVLKYSTHMVTGGLMFRFHHRPR